MKKLLVALPLLIFIAASAPMSQAPAPASLENLVKSGNSALEDWRFVDADKIGDQINDLLLKETNAGKKLDAYYFLANFWFYKGQYRDSLQALEIMKSISSKQDKDFDHFYERVKKLSEVFGPAKEAQSEHFRMRWVDPRDEVLAKPGLAIAEKAYVALKKDFNYTPPGEKILIEIYPRIEDLGAGVDLPEKMFKDSGTVAICKFRRLMLVSPRALLFGYDYQTTISHEQAHFFVYSRNGDTVPIWMHEGLAKYEESSYLGRAGEVDTVPRSFLTSAIRNNELVTFAQMSPTFAQFKTPKEGQLAFAEVETMLGYLRSSCGDNAWFKTLDLLKSGKGDKAALEQVCGRSFDSVWSGWKQYVLAKNWEVIPGAQVMKLEFKEQTGKEEDEEGPAEKGKGADYMRIGDLLRDRSFFKAASVEYAKAANAEPFNPRILNKLGLAQILANNFSAAVEPLLKLTSIYPTYSTGFVNLGNAYYGLKDDVKAQAAFEHARALKGDQAQVNELKQSYSIIMKKSGG